MPSPTTTKSTLSLEGISAPSMAITRPDGREVTVHAIALMPPSGFPLKAGDARGNLVFDYDAAELRAEFAARNQPGPLDVDHATEGDAPDTRARGWIYELCTSEDHPSLGLLPGYLYGLTELTPLGVEALANRYYGYTSAVFFGEQAADNRVRITSVKSNALTNNPASDTPFACKAIAKNDVSTSYTEHQQLSVSKEMLEQLIALLGLAEGADEAAVLAAIAAVVDAQKAAAEAAAKAAEAAPAVADPVAEVQAALSAMRADIDALKKQTAGAVALSAKRVTTPATTTPANPFGLTADEVATATARGISLSVMAKTKADLAYLTR